MSTNLKKYASIFGAESNITFSQYVAEIIISRQSKLSKLKLPHQFWKKTEYADWTKKYLNQKRRADALVKSGYKEKAILRAILSQRGIYICSLFNKNLDGIIEEEQRKLDIEEATIVTTDIEISDTNNFKPSVTSSKKTKISKLRDD